MTRRRWIADEVDLAANRAALTGQNARHLARVLRARVGQQFDVACGDTVRRGEVISVTDERVEFVLGDEVPATKAAKVTLWLAIFKFDRFEWAVEKCTELGAMKISPVIAQRTEPHLASAAAKRVDRWRKIAKEAAQQSRRAAAPEIAEPLKLKEALASFDSSDARIVLAENEKNLQLADALGDGAVVLTIGPEGGWTDDELKQFAASGWTTASLGPTILRAETAAIAATTIAALAR